MKLEKLISKSQNKNSIRVLYKEIKKDPKVKIINNVQNLKKEIINKKLNIIPYESAFIICNNNELMKDMSLNIALILGNVSGDFILVNINKKTREFESLSQDDIIWYSQSLNNNSFNNEIKPLSQNTFKNFFNKNFYKTKNQDYETTLINILNKIQILLEKISKNGD